MENKENTMQNTNRSTSDAVTRASRPFFCSLFIFPFSIFTFSFLLFSIFFSLISTPVAHAGVLSKPPNNLGLVGYWSFNEGVGTVATDFSNNGYAMSLTNTAWESGKFGSSLAFDGTGDYAETSSAYTVINGSNTLTICAWVYLNTTGTTDNLDDGGIFAKSASGNAVLLWYNVNADGTGDRTYSFNVGNTSTGNNRVNATNDSAVAQQWQFVCGVMNTSARSIYIDGVYNNGNSSGDTTVPSISDIANIGTWVGSGSFDFNGKIDEVRVYTRALSANEILDLYETGLNVITLGKPQVVIEDGLIGWWTFDSEGVDWITGRVTDKSGNGNHGTTTGMSATTTPAPGVVGQAFNFDGYTGWVDLANVSAPLDKTFAVWLYRSGTLCESNWRAIIEFGNDSPFFGMQSGTCIVRLYSTGLLANSNTALPLREWTHVAVTSDSTSNVSQIYFNGVPVGATGTASTHTTLNGGIGYHIGDLHFEGLMDDFRMYDRALSADEIFQLYSATKPIAIARTATSSGSIGNGLVVHFTFDGSSVNWDAKRLNDMSGNGNHATTTRLSSDTTPIIGKIGQAFHFRNTNDNYLLVNQSSSINNLTQRSFCFWYKPDSLQSWDQIMTKGNNTIEVFTYSDGRIELSQQFSTSRGGWQMAAGSAQVGVMKHYCFTYDNSSTANNALGYINGASVSLTESPTPSGTVNNDTTTGNGHMYIGNYLGGSGNLHGILDDFRMYNRILTPAEVKQIYLLGK